MYKVLLLILIGVTLLAVPASAHPPTEVELSFDKEESLLNIQMRHVTRDGKDHYIRRITVFHNDSEHLPVYNHKQINPKEFEIDVSVEAEEGDEITVQLRCSEGGVGHGILFVPKEANSDEDKEQEMDE